MRSVLLQAMGLGPNVKASVARLELRRGDRLLLCSDGLSNKIPADELLAIIDAGPSLAAACKRLVALANERGGEDNITALIAELRGEGLTPPVKGESMTQTLHTVTEFEPDTKI
jgi:serine/threonine protein phosphatase PrpC